ncbi:MAG: hypothetical protein ACREBJ_03720, partial [Nitrosotalea sp.]
MEYNNRKQLYEQVQVDTKKGVKQLYNVKLELLSINQTDNQFAERFVRKEDDNWYRCNNAMRNLWTSYKACGNRYANPPLARFSSNGKKLEVVQGNSRVMAAKTIGGCTFLDMQVILASSLPEDKAQQLVKDENSVRSPVSDYAKLTKIQQLIDQGYSTKKITELRGLSTPYLYGCKAILRVEFLMQLISKGLISSSNAIRINANP